MVMKEQVIKAKYKNKNITLEEVLILLHKEGYSCAIIDDDNNHWAVSSSGFQSLPENGDVGDIMTTFAVSKIEWKNSPREAMLWYLQTLID